MILFFAVDVVLAKKVFLQRSLEWYHSANVGSHLGRLRLSVVHSEGGKLDVYRIFKNHMNKVC